MSNDDIYHQYLDRVIPQKQPPDRKISLQSLIPQVLVPHLVGNETITDLSTREDNAHLVGHIAKTPLQSGYLTEAKFVELTIQGRKAGQ